MATLSAMPESKRQTPMEPLSLPSVDVPRPRQRRRILPGFSLTLTYTLIYLSVIVLIPLLALLLKVVTPTEDYPSVFKVVAHVYDVATDEQSVDSYKLSFGLSFAAALLNALFGFVAAWVLVRYSFPGRKIFDALIDLPFAMPTAVAGLALTQIFSTRGYIGGPLHDWFGWRIAYTPWGILIAMTFIGFPFVVRTLQPVLSELSTEVEEAAACLGANRWQTFWRVIFPTVAPALVTGVMLAFGRAVGEYGSIVFISSMIPYQTVITPYLIIVHLEENDYVGAAGLGFVMLAASFAIIVTVNIIQYIAARRRGSA
jgi:sulfate transport system permease protein